MVSITIFGVLVALVATGVECGYASVSTGSSSSSDGTGQSFTAANMNGQGQFVHTQTRPGVPPVTTAGMLPLPPNNNNQYYGPANIGQPGFGLNYGPAYPYGPGFGTNTPAYNPYPQQPFGFNSPFQPLQPFQPIQPVQPFAPFPSLATPQEFNAFLNGIQQQYIAYFKQQQELLNAWKNTQQFGTGYGGVPNYAYATGGFGPNGIQQTAGVFPANKNKPNVDSRIDPSENAGAGNGPGYFGIQTSSFSSSSDVNGLKKHKEAATTTVNDNGKVSSYTVEN